MASRGLKIDELRLDLLNPRISEASDQRAAMQSILDDQGLKLVNLAESISEVGLNPMDRLLVFKSDGAKSKYTVLEGNRRVLAMKILKNPACLSDLEVSSAIRKRLERAAENFNAKTVEPIACYEFPTRAEGSAWLIQRHNGEDEGRGVVGWSSVAGSRFRGRDHALQALEFVGRHADLTAEQRSIVEGRFPITTLRRLLDTPDVRMQLGFHVEARKLMTALPLEEAIKPLKRMVIDLAEKNVKVTQLKSKNQQLDYISNFSRKDCPNLSKATGPLVPIEEAPRSTHNAAQSTRRPTSPAVRKNIVPRAERLNITNAKTAEIYKELRTLQLNTHPNAIAVLLRVFVENSVDHYLSQKQIPLTVTIKGHTKDKSLKSKIEESIADMIATGATKKDFAGVVKAIQTPNHPFSVDLLHLYIHNRFVSPTERDLIVAWDNAKPLFDRIWP